MDQIPAKKGKPIRLELSGAVVTLSSNLHRWALGTLLFSGMVLTCIKLQVTPAAVVLARGAQCLESGVALCCYVICLMAS